MNRSNYYPTIEHENAAKKVMSYFSNIPEIDSVLLTCSCARGKASRDSCLDMCILFNNTLMKEQRQVVIKKWNEYSKNEPLFKELRNIGKYSHLEVDFSDGTFHETERSWTSGPDQFELEIGNTLVYSVPLYENGNSFQELRKRWLPYYDENIRGRRLKETLTYCQNNLDHIPLYIERELYFQSFDRLYNAYKEFLQGLFIAQRVYPISYDKWIKEQIVEILHLPELYQELVRLFEIGRVESKEIAMKAQRLKNFVEQYLEKEST